MAERRAPYRYTVEEIAPHIRWRDVNQDDGSGRVIGRVAAAPISPVLPDTWLQRLLHRLGIHRWHAHSTLWRFQVLTRWLESGTFTVLPPVEGDVP